DGVAGLTLGHDTAEGEAFIAFQRYCLELKRRGVLLAVASKNDPDTAKLGFTHPDSVLKPDDFAAFRANWEPKTENLAAIARELNLGLDSLVFVDDNPFERELVARTLPDVCVAKVSDVTHFAEVLDREGYFEPFSLTADDGARGEQYVADRARAQAQSEFMSYAQYLEWLEMKAVIAPFEPAYLERIAQLVNKTNQFNLTASRHTLAEVTAMASSPDHVTLYGRLADRFGDNGLVSVVMGRADGEALHIDTWLMSCRVLKRDFEHAMFAALCEQAAARGFKRLVGRYVPTAKNAMVASHYAGLGFTQAPDGTWAYELGQSPAPSPTFIERKAA
ncbi:MAG: HAD-IIIC family phosphatase, partial [Myxococcaceae bacterium]|nr:HAD-IIIC family phosphatase [Myxococcaceae bacterium]